MATEVQIAGLRELRDNLKKIGKLAQADWAIAMTSAGARLFADEARKIVPVKEGVLKKSIAVKRINKSPPLYVVTTRKKIGDKYRGRHAHLVEFGHKGVRQPKEGKTANKPMFIREYGKLFWKVYSKGARPHPFMRPAFDENVGRAIDRMAKVYNRRLEKWQQIMAPEPEES